MAPRKHPLDPDDDYWLSFVTTLDPNDGLGSECMGISSDTPRPVDGNHHCAGPDWPEYAHEDPVVMHLNTTNLGTIPDTYRAEQIAFGISQQSSSFRR
ncbi:hypothetical protein DFH09DRAFT_382188 [Mycena vulgaris]|nr:hypothetical protein DFH09DRAFT_382188 [Mycena vulgaris]